MKQTFSFAKVVPGGNATIILCDQDLEKTSLPEISRRLMDEYHIQAEQVAHLSLLDKIHLQMMGGEFCVNATRSVAALLASLCFDAFKKSSINKLFYQKISVSGASQPVEIAAHRSAESLENFIISKSKGKKYIKDLSSSEYSPKAAESAKNPSDKKMPCLQFSKSEILKSDKKMPCLQFSKSEILKSDKKMPCLQFNKSEILKSDLESLNYSSLHCAACISFNKSEELIKDLDHKCSLVNLEGISHLLVDCNKESFPAPHECLEKAGYLRDKFKLWELEASGVVWFKQDDRLANDPKEKSKADPKNTRFKILPAVYVKKTNTEHLETACGSASLAVALLACKKENPLGLNIISVQQPSSRILNVFISQKSSSSEKTKTSSNKLEAWVSGEAKIVATGTVYI